MFRATELSLLNAEERHGDNRMLDVIFLLAGVGFFLAGVAYAHFCERA
jgi:hypothetical protein